MLQQSFPPAFILIKKKRKGERKGEEFLHCQVRIGIETEKALICSVASFCSLWIQEELVRLMILKIVEI